MEGLKDNEDPNEDYWSGYEDEKGLHDDIYAQKLINEISIKDLCDGKEVMFQTAGDFAENFTDDDIINEISHYDVKSLRENRGAPLGRSFKEIAREMTNLTEDGLVKKQIISSGIGKVVPENAYVTVHYNLYKESCELPFDSTYLRNCPEKFKLGQGEALLGLEHAIKSMKKNENSMFFIKWELAFGALGCPDRIEGKCDIVADITLMNFMDLQTDEGLLDHSETDKSKIDFTKFNNQVKKLICNGSDEFSKGFTKNAVSSYRKALKILSNIRLSNEEQESIMLKQKVKCLVNLAICYNKLGCHEQACVACQGALSIDCNNVKANFHYGRANIALSNFRSAERYLLRANKLKPNDEDINVEIKRLNDKKALYQMKDRLFWKKALVGQKEEGNSQRDELPPLEKFEKELLSSLDESLKEKKPYTLSRDLSEDEMKICKKVAEERNLELEKDSHSCVFKTKRNN